MTIESATDEVVVCLIHPIHRVLRRHVGVLQLVIPVVVQEFRVLRRPVDMLQLMIPVVQGFRVRRRCSKPGPVDLPLVIPVGIVPGLPTNILMYSVTAQQAGLGLDHPGHQLPPLLMPFERPGAPQSHHDRL